MKRLVILTWLICGLAFSLADTPRWQTLDDLVVWLGARQELGVQDYMNSLDALMGFENQGAVKIAEYRSTIDLIDKLALNRFGKLRDARDFSGTVEYFETKYPGSLKNKMIDMLADGKDDEFSARIVYHSLGGISWAPPRQNTESLAEAHLHKMKLLNKLVAGSAVIESDFTDEDRLTIKQTLEKRWPVVLKDVPAARERKPSLPERREAPTGSIRPIGKQLDGPRSGNTDTIYWMVGTAALILVSSVIMYLTSRRKIKKQ